MAMTPLHGAVGIAIVKLIPIPWISLPLAFLSHIWVDLYPEWYQGVSGIKKEDMFNLKAYGWRDKLLLIIQFLLLVGIVAYIIHQQSWVMFFAVFLANLMDLWDFIWQKVFKKNFWFVHGGNFPFKVSSWQNFGMKPLQNAFLDLLFVSLLLLV